MEVPPGIEPGFTDLQSGASPLRHGTIQSDALYQAKGAGGNRKYRLNLHPLYLRKALMQGTALRPRWRLASRRSSKGQA